MVWLKDFSGRRIVMGGQQIVGGATFSSRLAVVGSHRRWPKHTKIVGFCAQGHALTYNWVSFQSPTFRGICRPEAVETSVQPTHMKTNQKTFDERSMAPLSIDV